MALLFLVNRRALVVVAEKMKHRVHGEEGYLVVEGVAYLFSLLLGSLNRDHYIAEDRAVHALCFVKLTVLVHWEGEDVGVAVNAAILVVKLTDILVIAEGNGNLCVIREVLVIKSSLNSLSYYSFEIV